VDIVKWFVEDPFVFCIVDFEGAVSGDAE